MNFFNVGGGMLEGGCGGGGGEGGGWRRKLRWTIGVEVAVKVRRRVKFWVFVKPLLGNNYRICR